MTTPSEVAAAAQLACLLEVSAPKPGNVSPGRHFHDTRYEDFLASAVAIGPALAAAGDQPLGATILAAVEATAQWVRSNTNLGIILLLAPLARAALRNGGALRDRVRAVLAETTVGDAAEVYAAIRRARPGGLGAAESEDVAAAPTVTLLEAMALAADRDSVAREYATDFAMTFEVGAPALRARPGRGARLGRRHRGMLPPHPRRRARHPHRAEAGTGRGGDRLAPRRARWPRSGGVRTRGRPPGACRRSTRRSESPTNARNPGTTADLTCAALFVVILEDSWNR